MSFDLLGAIDSAEWSQIGCHVVRPNQLVALGATQTKSKVMPETPVEPEPESTWSTGRILKYGLGGFGVLALGVLAYKYRSEIMIEARASTRHIGNLAKQVKTSVKELGSEHRSQRQLAAQEHQTKQITKKIRKLESELKSADQKVNDATRLAEQKANALRGLKESLAT